MNWLIRFGNAYDAFRKGSLENPSTSVYEGLTGNLDTDSGLPVDEDSTLGITSAYNAIQQISQDIATLTPKVYQPTGTKGRESIDHPVLSLLAEPNQSMSGFTLMESYVMSYLARGNGLIYIKEKRGGKELILVDVAHDHTEATVSARGLKFYNIATFYKTELNKIPDFKVLHSPNISASGLWGIDPVTNFRNTLALTMSQEKFNNKFYKNGASMKGFVTVPTPLKAGDAARIKEAFKTNFDHQDVGVLGAGQEYQSITMSPENAQFLESRQFSVTEIARIFNIPPHKLKSLERSTNNNIEHQSKEYYQDTIQPIVTKIEREFTRKLLTEDEKKKGVKIEFDMDEFQRADVKTRYEAYQIASTSQFMKKNEIREREGLTALPDSEDGFIDFQSPANDPS